MAGPAAARGPDSTAPASDDAPHCRSPGGLVPPVGRDNGDERPVGVLPVADASLAAGRGRSPGPRDAVVRPGISPVLRPDRLVGTGAARGRPRRHRPDDGVPRPRRPVADPGRCRDHRLWRACRLSRPRPARHSAPPLARSDLLLAVPLALADPRPRAGGLGVGRFRVRSGGGRPCPSTGPRARRRSPGNVDLAARRRAVPPRSAPIGSPVARRTSSRGRDGGRGSASDRRRFDDHGRCSPTRPPGRVRR